MFFAVLVFQSVSAQKTGTALPLKVILSSIEQQNKIVFNYLDEQVAAFTLEPPKPTFSLMQKLHYLKLKTGLNFTFITGQSISISKPEKEKLPVPVRDSLPELLSEVTIEGYLTTGISKRTDGTFRVSPKKYGILPGLTTPDILQTMQQIPGIMSVDETISNINIRGGTHDQNLFTWNGVRMFQTGHFFGLISAFNPLPAQEVSISKNGSSAFLGESVSGVVAISTKTDSIERSNSAFETDMLSAAFYSKIKTSKKSSFMFSGRRSYTDIFATPTYTAYSDRIFQNTIITDLNGNENTTYKSKKTFYFYDFTSQFQQKIGTKNELAFDIIGVYNFLDIFQSNDLETASRDSDLRQHNFGANINWKTNWDENNSTNVNVYNSYYKLDATNEAIEDDQKLNQRNSIKDIGLRIENHHIINDYVSFNNGYQYNETSITDYEKINNPLFVRRSRDILRTHALILETILQTADRKTYIKAGLRSNYIEDFNLFIFEPRLLLNHALSDQVTFEISGEMKSQTVSQVIDLQQDFLGIEKRRWTLANNDDKPIQKSGQIAAGYTFKSKTWLVTLDNFYKKVSGIMSRSQSFQNQLEYLKLNGSYSVLGTELLVQKKFGNFHTWLCYSFSQNKYNFVSYYLPDFASNFDVSQTFSLAAAYDRKNFKIALGSKWHTGRPVTTPKSETLLQNGTQIDYNDPNNENLGDYFQVNFSTSYQWRLYKNSTLRASFAILNLFDKKNIINRYYRINQTDDAIETVNTFSLKRTPNLSVKITF
ncbi:TonB-dependent receptor plug domain-containing protein [Flavobacterium sp. 3HN19-14]|uniref:TonB-dependent receptor plug domain-containing protein n=1 Tax=Flavobacterium sp. 3HN19-14 TaxID=3448133 RepID=UPI003EE2FC4A